MKREREEVVGILEETAREGLTKEMMFEYQADRRKESFIQTSEAGSF